MKTQTTIIALAAALFSGAVFADHNRIDEYGRKQGHWTEFLEREDVLFAEGNYVDGKLRGHWVVRFVDGRVEEGPILNGKRHGDWVLRWAHGSVQKGPYVGGKKHGDWVERWTGLKGPCVTTPTICAVVSNEYLSKGPYVADKMYGRWVIENVEDGTVQEGLFMNGKRHGKWVVREANGDVSEVSYLDGEVRRSVKRKANGDVHVTCYENYNEIDC